MPCHGGELSVIGALLSSVYLNDTRCEADKCTNRYTGSWACDHADGCCYGGPTDLCHSGEGDSAPWLRLELPIPATIDCVFLDNNETESGRLGHHQIRAGYDASGPLQNGLCYEFAGSTENFGSVSDEMPRVDGNSTCKGKYVFLYLPPGNTQRFVSLREVTLYGEPLAEHNYSVPTPPPAQCVGEQLLISNVQMSSTYTDDNRCRGDNCINGLLSTCASDGCCEGGKVDLCYTSWADSTPWIRFELPTPAEIDCMLLNNWEDETQILGSHQIRAGNDPSGPEANPLCFEYKGSTEELLTIAHVVEQKCEGKYVFLYKPATGTWSALALHEISLFGTFRPPSSASCSGTLLDTVDAKLSSVYQNDARCEADKCTNR
eukprot:Hpha_TRINITY_DN16079_c0_g1::TRINITY_DN16079_c0_g1_i13::g.117926::m.117926